MLYNIIPLKTIKTLKNTQIMKKFFSFFAAVLFAGSMMAATPLTCAEAAAQAANAGDEEYEVTGFVTSIKTAYSEQYNNISFWMADTKDGGEVLQAFRCTPESADKLPYTTRHLSLLKAALA